MTCIEIHQPETEDLIEERMASGAFENVEDLLLYALRAAPVQDESLPSREVRPETLEEMFAKARGLADDLDLRRDPSPGRPVELS